MRSKPLISDVNTENTMTIYIDADACPVTRIAEDIARKHGIPVTLLCDTNHQLTSDYSTVKVIGAGADAVDIALINDVWRQYLARCGGCAHGRHQGQSGRDRSSVQCGV